MIVNDGARETHGWVAGHGPISAAEIAHRTATSVSTVRGRLRAMEREGFIDSVANGPERLYVVGPRKLPASTGKVIPIRPATKPVDTVAMREKVYERALMEGLDALVVPAEAPGIRVSVPHPFDTGRVWIDTPGDLDAVLIELEKGPHMEEEWRAAA